MNFLCVRKIIYKLVFNHLKSIRMVYKKETARNHAVSFL